MSEKMNTNQNEKAEGYNFPLEKGVPLNTVKVIEAIGNFGRKFSPEGKGDFPQKVEIKTKDGGYPFLWTPCLHSNGDIISC